MLCLFFESAKLAHLQVAIVEDKGNVLIQLKDLDGKLLATINPAGNFVPTDYVMLTLTTCYTFEYIGDTPGRFIVYSKLVSKPNF